MDGKLLRTIFQCYKLMRIWIKLFDIDADPDRIGSK
jgi:hypothetical protein